MVNKNPAGSFLWVWRKSSSNINHSSYIPEEYLCVFVRLEIHVCKPIYILFRQIKFKFIEIFSMTPESIFRLCSTIAMIGWLVLIIASPFIAAVDKFLIGVIITLLAIVYAWLILLSFNFGDMKSFSTLDGVMKLFQNKTLVTAGWVYYLAFDLMVGIWIKRNSMKHGISHWLIIPCLLLNFMLGPVGLLLYLILRFLKTKKYFSTNYN